MSPLRIKWRLRELVDNAEDPRSGTRIKRPRGRPKKTKFEPNPPGVDPGIRYTGLNETPEEREERILQLHNTRSMSQRYQDLMDGTLSVEDLDDEECVRGQLRAADGTFRGRPPKAVPRELYLKMQSEATKRWENKLKGLVTLSIEALEGIVRNGRSEMVRYQAATYLMERTMGKTPDRVQISAEVKRWEGVASNILVDLGEAKAIEPTEGDTHGAGIGGEAEAQGLINDL